MNRNRLILSALMAFSLAWDGAVALAQTPTPTPPPLMTPAPAATVVKEVIPSGRDKTLMEILEQGGVIMIPLGLTSMAMIALIIDGFMRLRKDKLVPPPLVEELCGHYRSGNYDAAYMACKSRASVLANVVKAGLGMLGHGKDAVERVMEDALAKEISNLHTRIRYLSVIGVVSPMLGLTGTVLGMIRAFSTLGHSGIGDPSALASAIGEVLVATATGLFVAIPAFAFYYVFGNRITATTSYTEDVINGLFRGMPYPLLAGVVIGDDPIYAAAPSAQLRRIDLGTDVQSMESAMAQMPAAPVFQQPAQPVQPPVQLQQPIPQETARHFSGARMVAVGSQSQCPVCKQYIQTGVAFCPHCGQKLGWKETLTQV